MRSGFDAYRRAPYLGAKPAPHAYSPAAQICVAHYAIYALMRPRTHPPRVPYDCIQLHEHTHGHVHMLADHQPDSCPAVPPCTWTTGASITFLQKRPPSPTTPGRAPQNTSSP